ncbi:unnamed protein product [Pleuronectes platessa]|uniref:Uncharacterized protein n=1 Tax=Pleuronectes platessa TaxID=8262 RepID=A0A9N7V4G5_PLEPL|nr:unnamed protein product [Pleuronectes platessa]
MHTVPAPLPIQEQYKPKVQRQPTTTRSFRNWSPDSEEAVSDCFVSTEWNVLQEPHGNSGSHIALVMSRVVSQILNLTPMALTDLLDYDSRPIALKEERR